MYRDPACVNVTKVESVCQYSVEKDSSTISKIRSPSLFFSRTCNLWRPVVSREVGVTVRVCVC